MCVCMYSCFFPSLCVHRTRACNGPCTYKNKYTHTHNNNNNNNNYNNSSSSSGNSVCRTFWIISISRNELIPFRIGL
ncbi:hypothetical protein BDF20DRAFT_871775 [Mycotypha africana]|uniref:uncharacterized protein n=1 Tax=Mycotypha africana TaxID=64632 RepID=UPI002301A8D9|nr:uncharacterized protein BDF20DRAFT_871775 [Mycotypha africana]KAI8979804.1 hypothetical protein BDF20DRAFT_871775 [Mycotypha africana]